MKQKVYLQNGRANWKEANNQFEHAMQLAEEIDAWRRLENAERQLETAPATLHLTLTLSKLGVMRGML